MTERHTLFAQLFWGDLLTKGCILIYTEHMNAIISYHFVLCIYRYKYITK